MIACDNCCQASTGRLAASIELLHVTACSQTCPSPGALLAKFNDVPATDSAVCQLLSALPASIPTSTPARKVCPGDSPLTGFSALLLLAKTALRLLAVGAAVPRAPPARIAL